MAKKIFSQLALALLFAACSNIDNTVLAPPTIPTVEGKQNIVEESEFSSYIDWQTYATHGRGETKHRGGIGVLLLHRLADLRRRRLLPLRHGRMAGPHDISRGRRKQGHNAGAGRAGGCLSQKGVQGRHHAPAEPHLPSL